MNLPKTIGLKGKISAGKSTAAEYFIARGYKLLKFADPLKNMLRAILLSDEQIEGSLKTLPALRLSGATPRRAMQSLGDWGRDLHPDFWVNLWHRESFRHQLVIADDCRFPNEANMIRALGGVVIEIRRDIPGEFMSSCHVTEIQDWPADMCIFNEGCSKDVLFARLEGALEIWDEMRILKDDLKLGAKRERHDAAGLT